MFSKRDLILVWLCLQTSAIYVFNQWLGSPLVFCCKNIPTTCLSPIWLGRCTNGLLPILVIFRYLVKTVKFWGLDFCYCIRKKEFFDSLLKQSNIVSSLRYQMKIERNLLMTGTPKFYALRMASLEYLSIFFFVLITKSAKESPIESSFLLHHMVFLLVQFLSCIKLFQGRSSFCPGRSIRYFVLYLKTSLMFEKLCLYIRTSKLLLSKFSAFYASLTMIIFLGWIRKFINEVSIL